MTTPHSLHPALSLVLGIALAASASAQTVSKSPPLPHGDFTAVLGGFPGRIAVLDNGSHQLVHTFAAHPSAAPLAPVLFEVAPNGHHAYVLHFNNDVTKVDLRRGGAPPQIISPDPYSILPFFPLPLKDCELSPDGRYLVVTAYFAGGWPGGASGLQTNRVSVYDLAAGTDSHFFIDQTPNPYFKPRLDIAITDANVAWICDGDLNKSVGLDLATLQVTALLDSADTIVIGGGFTSYLPTHDFALFSGLPLWLPDGGIYKDTYIRLGAPAQQVVLDYDYDAASLSELETGAAARFVAASRPLAIGLPTGLATDQILLFDLLTQKVCETAKVSGAHRFREIEFADDVAAGFVFGLDLSANAFLRADFSAFKADPQNGGCTLASFPLPAAAIHVDQESDGLLTRSGAYVFHDGHGKVAWIDAFGTAQLIATADSGLDDLLGTIDLEVAGSVRPHRD